MKNTLNSEKIIKTEHMELGRYDQVGTGRE